MIDRNVIRAVWVSSLGGCMAIAAGCASGQTFATPQEAMQAVGEIAGSHDEKKVDALFGPGATDVVWSGDPVADREDGQRVKEMIQQKVQITHVDENEATAVIGNDQWPFPIPLERVRGGWRFDLAAGKEELQNRRVGRNELLTIATLHACVDAQQEYAAVSRDGEPLAYAQKFLSMPDLHDGLYWPVDEGTPPSPLGPLVADAAEEGYKKSEEGPTPYHGYYYKILTGQGTHAPGGKKSYLDNGGRMVGGFAIVAWPATYGNSGIMTFIVSKVGIIYQKDLGPPSDVNVPPVTLYDPDETWQPVTDS